MGISMIPVSSWRDDYARSVKALRAALDAETLTAAWGEGRAMTLEEAVEYALEPSSTGDEVIGLQNDAP